MVGKFTATFFIPKPESPPVSRFLFQVLDGKSREREGSGKKCFHPRDMYKGKEPEEKGYLHFCGGFQRNSLNFSSVPEVKKNRISRSIFRKKDWEESSYPIFPCPHQSELKEEDILSPSSNRMAWKKVHRLCSERRNGKLLMIEMEQRKWRSRGGKLFLRSSLLSGCANYHSFPKWGAKGLAHFFHPCLRKDPLES